MSEPVKALLAVAGSIVGTLVIAMAVYYLLTPPGRR